MSKYVPAISHEEFVRYANGDYEDQLIAMHEYRRRTNVKLTLSEIAALFSREYRSRVSVF